MRRARDTDRPSYISSDAWRSGPWLAVAGLILLSTNIKTQAQDLPPPPQPTAVTSSQPSELQLEVFVNGVSSQLIARFRRDAGAMLIEPVQLKNVGILPAKEAERPDGWIDISRLPGVSFVYDEENQAIRFDAPDRARAPKVIDAEQADVRPGEEPKARVKAQSGTGALLNYTLYGSTGGSHWDDVTQFQGLSALLEARAFSPYGLISSSQVLSTSHQEQFDTIRLDTTWSYSDEDRLVTYSAGDIINGGLAWTRPTRLGGIQIQRNFSLRPDMVTMPLPALSGSAAVPSTVDVYVNNARRLSQDVSPGPFAISNIPIVTGAGTAQMVVRDSLGRQTVTETPFFASSELLAGGLWDYSAELGFARRSYGTLSNDYDDRPMGSATLRYGLTDDLTVEGHAEAGEDFLNGGAGGVFQLGGYGIGSLSGAMSRYNGDTGYQFSAGVEGEIHGVHLYARTQRSFGDYNDIASITAPAPKTSLPGTDLSARPPKALDQVSISSPLRFDETTLNLSFTNVEAFGGERSRIVGLTANRSVGERGNLFLTAYTDLAQKNSMGIYAGFSWSFGSDKSASLSVSDSANGAAIVADASKSEGQEVGSYGWRVRAGAGENRIASATGSYRSSIGRFEGGAEQFNDTVQGHAQLEGSIAAAGGGIFMGGRIDDAFTVVDAGAPNVGVLLENRPIGETDRHGKILLPGLRSYGQNNISLDPTNLPLDARIDRTRQIVVPSEKSGSLVDFHVETGMKSTLLTLRDEQGTVIAAGSTATTPDGTQLTVGYDGQVYVEGQSPGEKLTVTTLSGTNCIAEIGTIAPSDTGIGQGDATCGLAQ